MLHEHHVLTSTTVQLMAFPSPRSARQRLLELHQWDVVDRFQPLLRRGSAPMHYVLGPTGAVVLAAEEGIATGELGYRRDDTLAIAHRHTLAHTVAINDLFANLINTTTPSGGAGAELTQWWSERRCNRYVGDLARPDAYGQLHLAAGTPAGRCFEWFLELDFGTEALPRVTAKLDGYAHLAAAISSGANRSGAVTVLFWFPGRRRETHAREHLAAAVRTLERPDRIRIATASPAPEEAARDGGTTLPGPVREDFIWQPLEPARPISAPRCSIVELAHRWATPRNPFHQFISSMPPRATRTADLPPPAPVPPDSATFNPATFNPATFNPASAHQAAELDSTDLLGRVGR